MFSSLSTSSCSQSPLRLPPAFISFISLPLFSIMEVERAHFCNGKIPVELKGKNQGSCIKEERPTFFSPSFNALLFYDSSTRMLSIKSFEFFL